MADKRQCGSQTSRQANKAATAETSSNTRRGSPPAAHRAPGTTGLSPLPKPVASRYHGLRKFRRLFAASLWRGKMVISLSVKSDRFSVTHKGDPFDMRRHLRTGKRTRMTSATSKARTDFASGTVKHGFIIFAAGWHPAKLLFGIIGMSPQFFESGSASKSIRAPQLLACRM